MKKLQAIKYYTLALIDEGYDSQMIIEELYHTFGHLMSEPLDDEVYGISRAMNQDIVLTYYKEKPKTLHEIRITPQKYPKIQEEVCYPSKA